MCYQYITIDDYANYIEKKDGLIWKNIDEICPEIIDAIFKEKVKPKYDYATPLDKGKSWLYELTLKYQPKTAQLLLEGGDLLLSYERTIYGNIILTLFQECQGKILQICRRFYNDNPGDPGFDGNRKSSKTFRFESLPSKISSAYYHRFDGLNIPLRASIGVSSRILPFPISRPWQSIDGYLGGLRLSKKYLPLIEERIPGVRPKTKGAPYTNFMMFLDTRPKSSGKKGDVLFVKNHVQDGLVYHIKDAEIENMRILSEPEKAIDLYCEQVLLKNNSQFDFLPYTSDL